MQVLPNLFFIYFQKSLNFNICTVFLSYFWHYSHKKRKKMKSEIEKLGAEMRGEKVGIETLKQIQKVKAKIIKQAVDTYNAAINKTGGLAIAFGWVDEAIALGNVLGKYKKIGAEWQDLDGEEAKELQAHFILCLKEQGFDKSDADMLEMAIKINDYVMITTNFFKEMAESLKK